MVAKFCPAAVASEPGEIANALVLDAERISGTLTAGVVPAVGAKQTPLRTSPALAVRRSVKVSVDAPAAVVFAIVSVIEYY